MYSHQQVPCPVWPARGTQRRAPSGRAVSVDLSLRAPGSSASGLAIQASPPADDAVTRTAYRTSLGPGFAGTGRQLAGARSGLRRDWRTRQGAPYRARGAGRTAPSTPWTGRTIAARCPPGSQPLERQAAILCAVFFLECPPGLLQTRLSSDATASLQTAPG